MDDTKRIWDQPHGRWSRFAELHMNGLAYGGLMGNARGVARFAGDLLRHESVLLNRGSKAALFAPQYDLRVRLLPVTLGWHPGKLKRTPYVSKPGGGPGFSSNVRLYPELRLGTVFLCNQRRATESDIQAVSDAWDAPFVHAVGPGVTLDGT
jgi:D-alanyl-D-alanine carboxypeptidase